MSGFLPSRWLEDARARARTVVCVVLAVDTDVLDIGSISTTMISCEWLKVLWSLVLEGFK